MGGKLGKNFTHVKQVFFFFLVVKIMFIVVEFSLFGSFSMLTRGVHGLGLCPTRTRPKTVE